jgi:hypothetical protein
MNRVLDTTDTAFGRAVQSLNFRRRTLSAKLLWSPLPQDWEMGAPLAERRGATLTIPHEVLEHDFSTVTASAQVRVLNSATSPSRVTKKRSLWGR